MYINFDPVMRAPIQIPLFVLLTNYTLESKSSTEYIS